MKVHSDVSVQMTLGHGTKVPQITYLTAPCRRDRRDDQNGHLDYPIWSSDGEITPPGKSPTRPCQAGRLDLGRPAWHFQESLSTQYHCIGDSPIDPQTLGHMPKVKVRPKGLICPSNGLPKWSFDVGLIIQGWTCTYMQRNTRGTNANHWMKLKTSGGMDEFVTWIEWPTFHMNNGQPTENRLGRETPHRPSHIGG